MCTVLILRHAHPVFPLLIAANRDEMFGRPATGLEVLGEAPRLLAGRDLERGGTWMGVTARGFFAGLTNLRPTERPATALAHHLRVDAASPPSIEVAAAKLAEAFNVWMTRWETLGFQPILDAWRARTAGLDGPAVARLGRETIEGRAEGVGPDGALKLRLADGSLRLISAGDVFFGEAA